MVRATSRFRWLGLSILIVAILLVVSSMVMAQTEPEAQAPWPNELPSAPPSDDQVQAQAGAAAIGPLFKVVSSAEFTTDGYVPDGFFLDFNDGTLQGAVATGACLAAPLDLPAGVTLTGMEVRINDANATDYEWFYLNRVNLATGVGETIAEVSSPIGTTAGLVALVDDTITQPLVSNMYTYQVVTCARLDVKVYGVRVGYGTSVHMPLITR